jgi:hypothetical protein
MTALWRWLERYLAASLQVLDELAIYLLASLLLAGVLAVFVPRRRLLDLIGRRRRGAPLRAALMGVPLPLCSCGVIPTAIALRRHGAGRGATVSFLISTPETGVDSIATTYALMDPLMTAFRPLAAFLTALVAGLAADQVEPDPAPAPEPAEHCSVCGQGGPSGHEHSCWQRIRRVIGYAIDELFDDLAKWLLLGIALAGLISLALPPGFADRLPGGELAAMAILLVAGIPLYVCASASTPIAAALVAKGLSPGVALVFLLAGPATNVATILIVGRELGRRTLAIYLGVIAGMSVALGLLLNRLYGWLELEPKALAGAATELFPGWLHHLGAIVFLLLSARWLWRRWAGDIAVNRRRD